MGHEAAAAFSLIIFSQAISFSLAVGALLAFSGNLH